MAIIAQILVLRSGYLSSSADESARALSAWKVTLSDAIQPDVWPPFYKLVNGGALRIYRDMVITPRVLSFVTGLAVLWVVMSMADRLFGSPRITLITGLMAAVLPHRLLFSIAPMSEVYLYLFWCLAAIALLDWLRTDQPRYAVLMAAWTAIATTVRYEAWLLASTAGVVLLYRFAKDKRGRKPAVLAALVTLTAFPVIWTLANAFSSSDIDYLSITRQQSLAAGTLSARTIFVHSAMAQFLIDLLYAPGLVIGVAGLFALCLRRKVIVRWTLVVFLPMILLTASTTFTQSIPFAARWRLGGVWTLLLLPFVAFSIHYVWSTPHGRLKQIVALVLLLSAIVPLGIRSATLAQKPGFTFEHLELGASIREYAESSGKLILLEPTSLDYLHIVVASNRPEIFTYSRGDDPYVIALFTNRLEGWERERPDLVDRYLHTNWDLAETVHSADLACANIGAVVVRTGGPSSRVLTELGFSLLAESTRWSVLQVNEPCLSAP